ncbi:MAG: hypothetical protein ACT4PT_10335 [Methanobacteriota archaeon]
MQVELPPDLASEVRALVATGAFPDETTAVASLVRLGLRYLRSSTAVATAGAGAVPPEDQGPWEIERDTPTGPPTR